jgi:probable phosphoglycerate mutase
MTAFFLVRHGAHKFLGRSLCGRRMDVALNRYGAVQAMQAAERLARSDITRIISSPRRRAVQTAQPIARACRLRLGFARELDEADFGAWAGLSFEILDHDPRWHAWNRWRESSRPPGGESMGELQMRIVNFLYALGRQYPGECLVLVSHAEPIRAALLYARHIPLDDFMQVQIEAGSVHELAIDAAGALSEPSEAAIERGAA